MSSNSNKNHEKSSNNNKNKKSSFNVIFIIQTFLISITMFFLASYFITETWTWGYQNQYTNWRNYIPVFNKFLIKYINIYSLLIRIHDIFVFFFLFFFLFFFFT